MSSMSMRKHDSIPNSKTDSSLSKKASSSKEAVVTKAKPTSLTDQSQQARGATSTGGTFKKHLNILKTNSKKMLGTQNINPTSRYSEELV